MLQDFKKAQEITIGKKENYIICVAKSMAGDVNSDSMYDWSLKFDFQ